MNSPRAASGHAIKPGVQFVDGANGGDALVVDLLHEAAVADVKEVDGVQERAVVLVADVAPDDGQALGAVLGVPLRPERRDVAVEVVAVHDLAAGLRQVRADVVPHADAVVQARRHDLVPRDGGEVRRGHHSRMVRLRQAAARS